MAAMMYTSESARKLSGSVVSAKRKLNQSSFCGLANGRVRDSDL